MERCRSGRTGRSRKPLSSLRGTEGSNPSLSAILVFLAVSGRLTHHENSRVLKPFPSPLISDCIGQSQPRWGKEWGKSGENPIGPLPFWPTRKNGDGTHREIDGGRGHKDQGTGYPA